MKTCKGCLLTKPFSAFHKHANRADGVQVYCKECKSARASVKFKANPELAKLQAQRNKANRASNKAYIAAYKAAHGCMLCHEDHPAALDLHHRNPDVKDAALSAMLHNCRERIDEEIAKCVVLCSNCHRKHHAGVDGYEV